MVILEILEILLHNMFRELIYNDLFQHFSIF